MSGALKTTPAGDGFRMPGEFEPHAQCWMLWPEREDNWRRRALPAQRAFVAVAAAISRFEPVTVGASGMQYAAARAALPAPVQVVELASDDAWMRDVGPSFVIDRARRVRGVHWRFNAWGGLYRDVARDVAVAPKLLELVGCERYRAPLVTEGGAIHVDGQGTVLATEQSLLDPRRNPALGRRRIETLLKRYLGASHVIWLGEGIVDDETGGHIDNLACFASPGEVCLTWTDNRRDGLYRICRDALERLLAARDARGRRLTVHKLPSPAPLYLSRREAAGVLPRPGIRPLRAGQRLAASYVNFYLPNGAVVMPLLDGSVDGAVRAILRSVFPRRRIVAVPAREILLGGGGIHCITQQQPLGRVSARWSRAHPAAARLRSGRRPAATQDSADSSRSAMSSQWRCMRR